MKYLISFFILAIATSISLTETKKFQNDVLEFEKQGRKKWELFYKCPLTSEFAKKAIKQYNKEYKHTHYILKKVVLAEKSVEERSKIRVFFKACTKTNKKISKDRRMGRKHRRCITTCDHFRATIQEYRSRKPIISVRRLDNEKEIGKHESKPSKNRNEHSRDRKKVEKNEILSNEVQDTQHRGRWSRA